MASEESEMLEELGIRNVEELFSDIPNEVRTGPLNLEKGLPEKEVRRKVMEILGKNRTACEMPSFLGAGVYHHYIPAAVFELISRSEFYSSYTPYQPEISQGMLQALFEYQSFVCELTGMDAANSSMYDASTALAEAALMAVRITEKKNVLIPKAIHWEKKSVLDNYARGPGLHVDGVRYDGDTGMTDISDLRSKLDDRTSAVYVESPNLLGVFENLAEIKEAIGDVLLIVGANPLSLAVAEAPGNLGADIVVGEGQILGNPMNFGGPLVGIFACRKEHIRRMPGRVIGATNDAEGRRAFTMALQTREQHIRRGKATSNICTNESLGSVAFAIHVAILGRVGLRRVAKENILKSRYLAKEIGSLDGFTAPVFTGSHFNEFVVRSEADYSKVHEHLHWKGIQGGLALSSNFQGLENCAVFCTTEMHSKEDRDSLIKALEEFS